MTLRLSIIPPGITIGPFSATFDSLGLIAGRNVGTSGAWECGWTRLNGWTSSPIPRLLPHGYPHFPYETGTRGPASPRVG